MDKNEEFDLDFDFEKEYGFDPSIMDSEYDDMDLNLGDDFLGTEEAPAAQEEPVQNSLWSPAEEEITEEEPTAVPDLPEEVPEGPQRRRTSRLRRSHRMEDVQQAAAAEPEADAQPQEEAAPVQEQPTAGEEREAPAVPSRRRRKKSKMRIFKEVYLPPIIAAVALIMVLVFVIGSISRSVSTSRKENEDSMNASLAAESKAQQLDDEAARLVKEAAALAAVYDYEGAISLLDSFSGEITAYNEMVTAKSNYSKQQSLLVEWKDPSKIANLSFHVLIADPSRAFTDKTYGSKYNRNFVTTDEFVKILERLYDNGYVLVGVKDLVTATTAEDGTVSYAANSIFLPEGKKPIMLTETLVSYLYYMIDSDGDRKADAGGAGFANKLVLENGKVKAQLVTADGETVVGDYDFVPLLESFIESHPDFTYRGARATLAVCGYNGVFGYRIEKGGSGEKSDVEPAKKLVQALRDMGYTIACGTYENINYGSSKITAADIKEDLEKWQEEIAPVLGQVDILVYTEGADLSEYSGSKFEVLQNFGFRYYIGNATAPWAEVSTNFLHLKRIMVSGTQLANGSSVFNSYFSSMSLLNELRGTVPN